MDLHIQHTRTHTDTGPRYRGMSLARSSVVMDTSRHIRHPISRGGGWGGGVLSASEGLAPSLLPSSVKPSTPFLHPPNPPNQETKTKKNRIPLFSSLSHLKSSLHVNCGGPGANSSYLVPPLGPSFHFLNMNAL